MKQVIKWQKGEPKERGSYIVYIKGLDSNYVTCAVYVHETGWCHWKKEEIIAWCKLSEIEPYKEKPDNWTKFNEEETVR